MVSNELFHWLCTLSLFLCLSNVYFHVSQCWQLQSSLLSTVRLADLHSGLWPAAEQTSTTQKGQLCWATINTCSVEDSWCWHPVWLFPSSSKLLNSHSLSLWTCRAHPCSEPALPAHRVPLLLLLELQSEASHQVQSPVDICSQFCWELMLQWKCYQDVHHVCSSFLDPF